MDQEQKKKWDKKLVNAKSNSPKRSGNSSPGKSDSPDLNTIRKKYRKVTTDDDPNIDDLQLDPIDSREDDIEVEVRSAKTKIVSDSEDDSLTRQKLVIRSKSKGTLGFNG